MAIKERKQITGTTAQINAYEGHEGQIVWDKEKKTFVGMSGTAGKNYPLAPQAYVDTQFLPLTGGNMTGEFIVNNLGSLAKQNVPEYEELVLQVNDRANQWTGGFLTLRGHSGSIEEERGSFLLGARNKDGSTTGSLLGTTSGRLLWSGNEVIRATGLGEGWVRYSDGLQICWGAVVIMANYVNAVVNLPVPFSNTGYSAVAAYTDVGNTPGVSTTAGNKTTTAFAVAAASPYYDWGRLLDWVAIGRWK